MSLSDWGYSASFIPFLAEGELPARVTAIHSNSCRAIFEDGERLLFLDPATPPAAGDWIAASHERVLRILPRRSAVSRQRPGESGREQVLAANIDLLLIVSGLDRDLNPRRLERYLAMALASGTEPAFVLNKADLCTDIGAAAGQVRPVAAGYPVIVCSARSGEGIEAIRGLLAPGMTAALAGSSGSGKSTIVNALLGAEVRATSEVRASDDRGCHTTTSRELFLLPGGGVLLDQPGLREIRPWAGGDAVKGAFPEIARRAESCRFRDCSHSGEPGCAVAGAVDEARLANYRKLTGETGELTRKWRDRLGSRAIRDFLRNFDKRR